MGRPPTFTVDKLITRMLDFEARFHFEVERSFWMFYDRKNLVSMRPYYLNTAESVLQLRTLILQQELSRVDQYIKRSMPGLRRPWSDLTRVTPRAHLYQHMSDGDLISLAFNLKHLYLSCQEEICFVGKLSDGNESAHGCPG